MRKQINIEQRTPEWHAWRKSKLGASDFAAVMGVSPFKTPLQLWEEKVDSSDRQRVVTGAMQRGIDFEDEARRFACMKLGVNFQPACFEYVKRPYMVASLDGWSEGNGALEIKVPNEGDHMRAITKMVPEHYIPQCQGIMLITDTTEMWYVSYEPNSKHLAEVLIKRDDFYCEKLEKAIDEFHKHILEFSPPAANPEKDYVKVEDSEKIELELLAAREQAVFWDKKYEVLKDKAIAQVGGRNAYLGNLRITKSIRPGAVDYKRIDVLRGIDLEKYRKSPVISYRIS